MNKKALLVVSFGTSYKETREKTLDVIERELAETLPEYDFYKAFTSGMILKKLRNRDNIFIPNVKEVLDIITEKGYSELAVQPTHILNGDEYEKMMRFLEPYRDRFEKISVGKPMLTRPCDYEATVNAVMEALGELNDDEALVLMGHGTEHFTDSSYAALDYRFKYMGYKNVFVGTVEGFPEIEHFMPMVKELSPRKVKLLPFMIVAGDHAINDMASDDEDSWNSVFKREGFETEIILKGLGEFKGIRNIFKEHLLEAVEK